MPNRNQLTLVFVTQQGKPLSLKLKLCEFNLQ